MTVKDLDGMFDYGYWANRKFFVVVSQLTPEQFRRPVAGGRELWIHQEHDGSCSECGMGLA